MSNCYGCSAELTEAHVTHEIEAAKRDSRRFALGIEDPSPEALSLWCPECVLREGFDDSCPCLEGVDWDRPEG